MLSTHTQALRRTKTGATAPDRHQRHHYIPSRKQTGHTLTSSDGHAHCAECCRHLCLHVRKQAKQARHPTPTRLSHPQTHALKKVQQPNTELLLARALPKGQQPQTMACQDTAHASLLVGPPGLTLYTHMQPSKPDSQGRHAHTSPLFSTVMC